MISFKKYHFMVVLFAAVFMLSCQSSESEAQSQDGVSGSTDQLVITEYSDYQCPACAYFHPIVDKLKKEMGDKVEFRLRFYPLNGHRYSALAARAAQAAKNQGKFYEMHSLLFKNQDEWSRASNPTMAIVNYARQLNLDMNQFTEDLNSGETQKIVMQQKQQGSEMGVNSTPTFFIEGQKIDPLPKNYKEFKAVIEKHLKDKQG